MKTYEIVKRHDRYALRTKFLGLWIYANICSSYWGNGSVWDYSWSFYPYWETRAHFITDIHTLESIIDNTKKSKKKLGHIVKVKKGIGVSLGRLN